MIRNKKITSFLICLCIIVAAFSFRIPAKADGQGNVYYASPDGNDTNPGTIDQPWQTLGSIEDKLSPGDTLILRGGTYLGNTMYISKSGTEQAPITIKAYTDGAVTELPVIDVENKSGASGIWFNDGSSNIILDGIKVRNTRGELRGIELMPWPYPGNYDVHRNVIIRNCILENNNYGIGIGCSSNIRIENCSFDNIGGNLVATPDGQDGSGSGDAVTILNSEKIIVENCYIGRAGHYGLGTGLWTRDSPGALPCRDIFYIGNLIENHWGGGFGFSHSTDSVAQDNIVKYCGEEVTGYPKNGMDLMANSNIERRNVFMESGKVYRDSGPAFQSFSDFSCEDNRFYNNIIYENAAEGIEISQRNAYEVKNNKILNNIMYKNRTAGGEKLPWLKGDLKNQTMWFNISVEALTPNGTSEWNSNLNNNQFYNNDFLPYAEDKDYPGYDKFFWMITKTGDKFYSLQQLNQIYPAQFSRNIEENPMFINEGLDDDKLCDFNLQSASPCIDRGAHLTKTTDSATDSTQVKVEDSRFFTDGAGMIAGDKVKVGANEPVTITDIDYSNNILTLESPISYNSGDYADLPYNGTAPDMGVYESEYSISWTEPPTPEPTPTPTATPTSTSTPAVTFSDVPGNYGWAADAIYYLAAQRIISGYPEGTFLPGNTITRAEFAKMLTGAFGIVNENAVSSFSDVPTTEWYYKYVASLESNELTQGYGDGRFSPQAEMSREEMFTFNARAINKFMNYPILNKDDAVTVDLLNDFSDKNNVSDWARGYVATNLQAGLVKGSDDGNGGMAINPRSPIIRAEVAVVLDRTIKLDAEPTSTPTPTPA